MKKLFILIIPMLLFVISCRKSDRDLDDSTHTSKDHMAGEAIFNDVFFLVHKAAVNSKGISGSGSSDIATLFGCDTLIKDTVSSTMKLTLDFGKEACDDRSGKIIAEFSGKYDLDNSEVKVNFQNYHFKGYEVSGEMKLFNKGKNLEGKPSYTFSVDEGKVREDKTTMKWNTLRTLYWVDGSSSYSSLSDDRFIVEGITEGRTFKGNKYTTQTTENITISPSCTWPYAGQFEIIPEHLDTRILTLAPSCSKEISITIHGEEYSETVSL